MIVYFIVLFTHSMTTRYSKVILTHYHGPIFGKWNLMSRNAGLCRYLLYTPQAVFHIKCMKSLFSLLRNITIQEYFYIWTLHINSLCSKANCLLGFLRRTLYHCPSNLKEHAYKQIVLPFIEYCSSIWDPHQKSSIHKLKMIQHRAARFVLNKPWSCNHRDRFLHGYNFFIPGVFWLGFHFFTSSYF